MPSPPQSPLVIVALTIGVVILATVAGRAWYGWRVRRWCAREGYELVDWHGARFYEGPYKFLRSENLFACYIEVRDRQGLPRAGYLLFGSFWMPFSTKVEVKWD